MAERRLLQDMNIYVDFDDCLCETGRNFSGLVAEMYGKDIPYEEIRYFDLQKTFSLTDEQYEAIKEMDLKLAMLWAGKAVAGTAMRLMDSLFMRSLMPLMLRPIICCLILMKTVLILSRNLSFWKKKPTVPMK